MNNRGSRGRLVAFARDQKILLIILGIVAALAFIRPMFISAENLFNILFQVSITSIIGIGMILAAAVDRLRQRRVT